MEYSSVIGLWCTDRTTQTWDIKRILLSYAVNIVHESGVTNFFFFLKVLIIFYTSGEVSAKEQIEKAIKN